MLESKLYLQISVFTQLELFYYTFKESNKLILTAFYDVLNFDQRDYQPVVR